MKHRNIKSFSSKKYIVIITLSFILLCILSILIEVLDIPHLLLRAPSTPINRNEIIIEIFFLFLVWLITAFILRKFESKCKQADEALRESEERLSLTLESAGLGLWDQNFKTNKIIRNERWAEMLGYELKDIESNIECWKNLIHPDDINQVEDVIKDHELGKTESIKIEHRMKTKTGDWKWILNWGKIIDRDKDGSPIRALGTHLDITERKQAEEQLHRLSKDREEIFQALGNATIIIDPEFNIVDVNRFTIEATGKSKDELLGKKCYEIFHGTKQPPQGCPAKQIITSAHYVPIEKEMPALGGTFLVSCTPVLNDQGNFVKIIHSVTNITGRKQAEEELKASEERFLSIFSNISNIAVQGYDKDRKVTFWNKASEKLYGYSHDEAMSRKLEELIIPDEIREIVISWIRNWHESDIRIPNGELVLMKKDKSPVQVYSSHVMIKKSNGEKEMFCIDIDITERKQAEEELKKHRDHLEKLVKERTKQLKESNAGLEAFAYTVSHDLRAPLRAMYGLAQALNEDYANKLDAEGKEYAQRIVNSSEYMDTMIRDLLEYSRLSIIELELKPVQLEQSIKQSMKQIKLEIKQSNAEINIKTPLPEVIGHYSLINQILFNILTNTIKFVKSGVKPKVKIWAEEKNRWIYLYVKDNGIGIAPENQEKIFNVFERLHGIETYPGTGIGLAIVKKGMERMGGKVNVESEIGKGSIFTIKLKKIL